MSNIDKIQFLKRVEIKDISYEDLDQILLLITEEYGNNYQEQEFYHENIIKNYIKKSLNNEGVHWKGAFYEGNLVGQLISEINHGIAYLKLAIVKRQFKRMGVMKLLSYYIERVCHEHTESDFKCVYALISNENIEMQKHIVKYNYVRLGTTPSWELNKFFYIFGIIVYDHRWKLCVPNPKVYVEIFNTVKNNMLNRFISINPSFSNVKSQTHDYEIDSIRFEQLSNFFPQKIGILSSKNEFVAEISENEYQKSWYDLLLTKEFNYRTKELIVKKILDKFEHNENINTLSIPININDQRLQNLLLIYKMKYFAYLPFYLNGLDAILMGKTKIKN